VPLGGGSASGILSIGQGLEALQEPFQLGLGHAGSGSA
jgi:hypothetical protein